MKTYSIICSLGEIVDKTTILKIKLSNVKDAEQRKNIQKEYDVLQKYIHMNDKQMKGFFDSLFEINKELWDLENTIREKSNRNVFDKTYIDCAEQIHKTNDKRYFVKRSINDFYDSDIKEEKIYNNNPTTRNAIQGYDISFLQKAQQQYNQGAFKESYTILSHLCEKYKEVPIDATTIELFLCYETASSTMGVGNVYQDKLKGFLPSLDTLFGEKASQAYQLYLFSLLKSKNYQDAYPFLKYIHPVNAPAFGIHPNSMSYFLPDDTNKTLLIYMSGGLGDKIMFSRFVLQVCRLEQENNILFLVDDTLVWMFQQWSQTYKNLKVIPLSKRDSMPAFDYHTNVSILLAHLRIDYESLAFEPYLQGLDQDAKYWTYLISPTKKNIAIHWRGNSVNTQEKYNRGMTLDLWEPLFATFGSSIQWISLQKDVTLEESALLEKYDVMDLSKVIDNKGDAFRDSLAILSLVDLIISTDTSLVHVAATANVKCWALLTLGCEWRWTPKDKTTAWYPNLKMIRQKQVGDWSNVMRTMEKALTQITTTITTTKEPV